VQYVVGVDIAGTNLVVGCVAEDGSALHGLNREPTRPEEGPDAVVHRLIGMAQRAMEQTAQVDTRVTFAGLGVGSPGPLDTKTGTVLSTPNLGWTDMPLRARLEQGLGLHTELDNDANCATLGEWWRGAAQGANHVLGLTIGTGIGGGILLDGRIYHGAGDAAGEFGHASIEADGRRCKCGNYGCLEAYASGPAIARRAIEAIEAGVESTLPEYVSNHLGRVSAETVYQAAKDGDELALEVVHETARLLGVGIANLVNMFNPEIVVICGGVTLAGDRLFTPLRREVSRRAFKSSTRVCRIVPGDLPGTAGVYGATKMFLQRRHPQRGGTGPHA